MPNVNLQELISEGCLASGFRTKDIPPDSELVKIYATILQALQKDHCFNITFLQPIWQEETQDYLTLGFGYA
jgi:hypothetical protein